MIEAFDESVRLDVYRCLADTGRAPVPSEVVEMVHADEAAVRSALRRLHDARHLVLDPDDNVILAHPFATTSFGFSVMGHWTLWWGGCAWDSFAIPHLVPAEPDVLVATRCPGCGSPLSWVVTRQAAPAGDEVAHFLVPMAQVWDDVVTTCSNQRLFCSHDCVRAWLDATGRELGYVMDLATLWRLAKRWYDGRLDPGYTRREPAQAKDYFRHVGLAGPFWGLED